MVAPPINTIVVDFMSAISFVGHILFHRLPFTEVVEQNETEQEAVTLQKSG